MSQYTFKTINEHVTARQIGNQINLSLKSNEPLKLSYNIGDASSPNRMVIDKPVGID